MQQRTTGRRCEAGAHTRRRQREGASFPTHPPQGAGQAFRLKHVALVSSALNPGACFTLREPGSACFPLTPPW
eukprot:scaffold27446_cov67-Isochrysis_galbana.AAC.1